MGKMLRIMDELIRLIKKGNRFSNNHNYIYLDFAYEVLIFKKEPLTIKEIWKYGKKLKLMNSMMRMKKLSKRPLSTLAMILTNDIQTNKNSIFIMNANYKKFNLKQEIIDNAINEQRYP